MPRKLRFYRTKNEFRKRGKTRAKSIAHSQHDLQPISIPLEHYHAGNVLTLHNLLQRLSSGLVLPQDWKCEELDGSITLYKIETASMEDTHTVYSVCITSDLSWRVHVRGESLPPSHSIFSAFTNMHSATEVLRLLKHLDQYNICVGNPDSKYDTLTQRRIGVYLDSDKLPAAVQERKLYPAGTVRSSGCSILVSGRAERCSECTTHRKTLNALLSKAEKDSDRSNPSSHTNFRYLTTPEKDQRLHKLHCVVRAQQQKSRRLQERIAQVIDTDGVDVDEDLHNDLTVTVHESSTLVESSFPERSFQRVFWDQQTKANSLKNSKSMRWHPLFIRWALYLRYLSSGAYETLRESGVIKLPSQRTLRDYTYYTESSSGFSAGVDKQLMDVAKMSTCPEREKYVLVLMDEMHIKQDIVYNKHTGAITGLTNLRDINDHLLRFEKSLSDDTDVESVLEQPANSMLVLMVRGLFSSLCFPYGQFPCLELSGDHMYQPFWTAVCRLERCGFKVMALTCDGLSANRKLFKLHQSIARSSTPIYKVENPYAEDTRYIYFISDPPHLMKTTRNAWYNNARKLWCNGKYISWKHLEDLYHRNRSQGLALIPHLKYEHIHHSGFSKMRVDLAVQVLSNRVSKALTITGGPAATETARFADMFDKFFDCLNVSSFDRGKRERSAFKGPFRSPKDFRFKWLTDTFLKYLSDWEDSVAKRSGAYTKEQRNMMLLSAETRLGLQITVHSFVELNKYLLSLDDVKVFLSNSLCQDPLEKFFGQQRQRGRTHENPNASQFMKNTQALRVVNGICRNIKGNCRLNADPLKTTMDSAPLPKRRKKAITSTESHEQ